MGRGLGKKWVGSWHVWKANCYVIAHSYEISSQSTICAYSLSILPSFDTKECVSSHFFQIIWKLPLCFSEILQPFTEELIPLPRMSNWHGLPSPRSSSFSTAFAAWSGSSAVLRSHLPALWAAEWSSRGMVRDIWSPTKASQEVLCEDLWWECLHLS